MRDLSEMPEQSACLRFAREFMPVVNEVLAEVQNDSDAATPGATGEVAADAPEKEEVASDATGSVFDGPGDDAATESSGAAKDEAAPAP